MAVPWVEVFTPSMALPTLKPSGSLGCLSGFENLLFLIDLFVLVLFALNESPFLGRNEEVHFLENILLLSSLLIASNRSH